MLYPFYIPYLPQNYRIGDWTIIGLLPIIERWQGASRDERNVWETHLRTGGIDMRMKMTIVGVIAAFVISIGAMMSHSGDVYADSANGNNGGCSDFGQFMPPTTPGSTPPGDMISDAAKDGTHLVNELKSILCP